jgi:hypothetical protein
MFSFYLPSILFADFMRGRIKMPTVSRPVVGIKLQRPERLKKFFQSKQNLIFMTAGSIREHSAAFVINRMPQPSLITFFPDETPHFIGFGFFDPYQLRLNMFSVFRVLQQTVIYKSYAVFFFFIPLITVSVLIFSTREISRIPLPLRVISIIFSLTSFRLPL